MVVLSERKPGTKEYIPYSFHLYQQVKLACGVGLCVAGMNWEETQGNFLERFARDVGYTGTCTGQLNEPCPYHRWISPHVNHASIKEKRKIKGKFKNLYYKYLMQYALLLDLRKP